MAIDNTKYFSDAGNAGTGSRAVKETPPSLAQRLSEVSDSVSTLTNRLDSLGDRVFGACPAGVSPMGGDTTLQDTIDRLVAITHRLDDAVNRLERIA